MITTSMPVASRPDALPVSTVRPAASETPLLTAQAGQPNPSAQINLTLGITVLTYHDAGGQIVASRPTQQQLNTYLMFGSPQGTATSSAGARDSASAMAMVA